MKVTKDNKALWHVQSVTDWHEEPYDLFIWSVNEPTDKQIEDIYCDETGQNASDQEIKDLVANANKYNVYAEEV